MGFPGATGITLFWEILIKDQEILSSQRQEPFHSLISFKGGGALFIIPLRSRPKSVESSFLLNGLKEEDD